MKYFIAPVLLGATTLYFANMAYQQSLTISGLSNELLSQEEIAFMQEQQLIELRKKLASVTTGDSKIAALQFEIERLNKRLANDTNADTQPTTSHSELANIENSPPEQSGLTEFANKVATQQSSEEPTDFVADALNLFEMRKSITFGQLKLSKISPNFLLIGRSFQMSRWLTPAVNQLIAKSQFSLINSIR